MSWRFWFDYCVLFAFFCACTSVTVYLTAQMLHVAKREIGIMRDYGFRDWWKYL